MQRSTELQVKSVILLAFAHFTVDFYTGFVAPLIPVLKEQMSLSITQAAFLMSVFSLTSSLGQTIFGFLFDRLRSLSPVLYGPLCAALFLSGLGIAESYPVAIVLVAAGGLGVAAFHPQGAALARAPERTPPQRRSLDLCHGRHHRSGYGSAGRCQHRGLCRSAGNTLRGGNRRAGRVVAMAPVAAAGSASTPAEANFTHPLALRNIGRSDSLGQG